MNGRESSASPLRAATLIDPKRALDELLRRALRVGDPRNPIEVAKALRQRYAVEATRLDQESLGFAVNGSSTPGAAIVPVVASGTQDSLGDREYRRVLANLEADLTALVDHPGNREWKLEISGWRSTLLREFEDGAAAASDGRDPAQRDRAFMAIRTLGEYARIARLVGVAHLELNHSYRHLANTLDEGAGVIRVLVGEALDEAGLGDGGIILDVPLIDLRQRADAVIQTLRQLAGTTRDPAAFGEIGYAEGLGSYEKLFERLDDESAPELKIYLREETLERVLDDLVEDIASASERSDPEALRRIGATLPLVARRFEQLALIASNVAQLSEGDSTSPSLSLARWVNALKLFVQAFSESRAGARLTDLAVPLAIAANQSDEPDGTARGVLRDLVSKRGELAREADCYLACCGDGPEDLRAQVKIDMVLYYVDRAVDLYALGTAQDGSWGDEEMRAVATGILASNLMTQKPADQWQFPRDEEIAVIGPLLPDGLLSLLGDINDLLTGKGQSDAVESDRFPITTIITQEFAEAEIAWKKVAAALAPRCVRALRTSNDPSRVSSLLEAGVELLFNSPRVFARTIEPRRAPTVVANGYMIEAESFRKGTRGVAKAIRKAARVKGGGGGGAGGGGTTDDGGGAGGGGTTTDDGGGAGGGGGTTDDGGVVGAVKDDVRLMLLALLHMIDTTLERVRQGLTREGTAVHGKELERFANLLLNGKREDLEEAATGFGVRISGLQRVWPFNEVQRLRPEHPANKAVAELLSALKEQGSRGAPDLHAFMDLLSKHTRVYRALIEHETARTQTSRTAKGDVK